MSDRTFVDTNVLLYAYDQDAGDKHDRARAFLRDLWDAGTGVLSTQVLQELYGNLTRKVGHPLSPVRARDVVRVYAAWPVITTDVAMILRASEIQERHTISFWDAMILAAAARAGATTLLTEDLNDGQLIEGVRVRNPFSSSAPA